MWHGRTLLRLPRIPHAAEDPEAAWEPPHAALTSLADHSDRIRTVGVLEQLVGLVG